MGWCLQSWLSPIWLFFFEVRQCFASKALSSSPFNPSFKLCERLQFKYITNNRDTTLTWTSSNSQTSFRPKLWKFDERQRPGLQENCARNVRRMYSNQGKSMTSNDKDMQDLWIFITRLHFRMKTRWHKNKHVSLYRNLRLIFKV